MIIIKINYAAASPIINVNYDVSPIYVRVMYGGAGDSITEWGEITGTLSNQTDLQNALNAKVPYNGAIANVDLGEYELKAGQVEFDQTPTGTAGVGVMRWNETDGTLDLGLKGGNVTLQVGQEQVLRVVNKTGADLLESQYRAVRIRLVSEGGSQGQRLAVVLAQGDNDPDSTTTIGIVTETITNNQEGFITTSGMVRGINTTGSLQGETWVDGDIIYLSPTVAGGITKVKPTAPQHLLQLGYVVYAHINNGKIFVKVDNGYELGELHDVSTVGATNGQVLTYNGSIWVPSTNGVGTVTSVAASGGTGISVSGSPITSSGTLTITNTAPDQVVALTQGGTTTITGTYPNFTISSADQYSGTVTSVGLTSSTSGITITGSPVTTSGNLNLAIATASGSANGLLSSTDWTTFNSKQGALTLTTTGTSGAATLIGNTLNIPQYEAEGNYVTTATTLTINGTTYDLSANRTWSVGTVTSVAALTLGTSGTDLSSSVANGTTTPVITLNVPTASATNRGALSSADWTTFNNKQNALTNPVTGTGTTNYVTKWTSGSAIGNSLIYDNGTNVGIGTTSPNSILEIAASTPIFTIAASDNLQFHGIEFRQGAGFDAFIKQLPQTGEFRISNGRSAVWGGFTTFYTDTSERMRITSGGNVLIGTTTDSGEKLVVSGTSLITGAATFSSSVTAAGLRLSGSNHFILNSITSTQQQQIQYQNNGTNKWQLYLDATTNNLSFYSSANNADRFVLTEAGAATFSSSVTAASLIVNTSGQARSISTFHGLGSDGQNIFIGGGGLSSGTGGGASNLGSRNTANGVNALYSNTTGYRNTVNGSNALYSNTTGYLNTVNGSDALFYNTTGYSNTVNGFGALYSNTTGYQNTANGVAALFYNTTGYSNIANGFQAGFGTGANANTTGNNNIFIGNESVGVSATESNRTWIGNSSTTSTWLGGNLLIGTTTDSGFKLDVNGTARVSGASTFGGTLTVNNIIDFKLSGSTYYQLFLQSPSANFKIYNSNYGRTDLEFTQTTGAATFSNSVTASLIGNTTTVRVNHNEVAALNSGTAATLYLNYGGGNVITNGLGGNLLVGTTTNSGFKLDVNGTIRGTSSITGAQFLASNTNGIALSDNAVGGFLSYGYNSGRTNAAGHYFYNGISTELMRITSGGNVGIGTTSPTEKLDVNGNIQIANAGYIKGTTYAGTKITIDNDLTLTANRDVYIDTGVVFKDGGNVGIGTTSPTAALDIPASTTARATMRIRSGVAPTTPNDGDIWFDGTDIKMRIGGVTKTFTLT